MKCQFPLRNFPAGMFTLFQAEAGSRRRSAVLRIFAMLGTDEVAAGADIRLAAVLLCSRSGTRGSFGVRIPDGSMLSDSIHRLNNQLMMGRGNVFLLLAILGWERSHLQQAPAPVPVLVPSDAVQPASLGVDSDHAVVHRAVAARSPEPAIEPESGSTTDDEMNVLGEKLLSQYDF